MQAVFLLCAVAGGTILVLQVVLSLLGMGLDHVVHIGGDIGGHLADAGSHSGHLGHLDTGDGAGSINGHGPADAGADATIHGDHQALYKLGRLLTFQTILAFVTFFGIGGLATLERGRGPWLAVLVGMGTGFASMLVIGFLFRALGHLQSDGTIRLSEARGARGRVYLSIPGDATGTGKVIAVIGGRELELAARTSGPMLRTGEEIVVNRMIDDHTVEVVAAAAYMEKPAPLY